MSSWMSFNAMWALQVQDALAPIGDSAAEQQAIYNAIVSVSQSAKVDARVILAVIIDEVSLPIVLAPFLAMKRSLPEIPQVYWQCQSTLHDLLRRRP